MLPSSLVLFLISGIALIPTVASEKDEIPSGVFGVFNALNQFQILLRLVGNFVGIVRKKVIDATEPSRAMIEKLKRTGPKINNSVKKLVEYLKEWSRNTILGGAVRAVLNELDKVKKIVQKINDFLLGGMKLEDKKKLDMNSLGCCGDKCPCTSFDQTEPVQKFVKQVTKLAEDQSKKLKT